MKTTRRLTAVAAAMLLPAAAHASSLYFENVPLTGPATTGVTDLIGTATQINWSVTVTPATTTPYDLYTYRYEMPVQLQGPGTGVSHFILDISDSILTDNTLINEIADSLQTNGEGDTLEFKNTAEGLTGVLKFDFGADENHATLYYEITSRRVPVWSHLFIKTGHLDTYNTGFATPSMTETDYLPAPDTDTAPPPPVVPTPAAVSLGLLALATLAARRR
jgi:MYXO-CTERM domain-containing protein